MLNKSVALQRAGTSGFVKPIILTRFSSVLTKNLETTKLQKSLDTDVLAILESNEFLHNKEYTSNITPKSGPQEKLSSKLNVFLLYKLLKDSKNESLDVTKRFPTLHDLGLKKFDDLYLPQGFELSESEVELESKIYDALKSIYDISLSEKDPLKRMGPNVKIDHGVGYGIQKDAYGISFESKNELKSDFISSSETNYLEKAGLGQYHNVVNGLKFSEKFLNSSSLNGTLEKIKSYKSILVSSAETEVDNAVSTVYSQEIKEIRQYKYNKVSLLTKGSSVTNVYDMQNDIYNPKHYTDVTVEDLMTAQCHLGESVIIKHPYNNHFIYDTFKPHSDNKATQDGDISIIDLNKTLQSLKRSCQFLSDVMHKGAFPLIIGNKSGLKELTIEMANKLQGAAVVDTWLPGTLTNVGGLKNLRNGGGAVEKAYKLVDRQNNVIAYEEVPLDERKKLELYEKLPDVIIMMNPADDKNKFAIREAKKLNIPVIGLCDTDMNHNFFDYYIPCNDDSIRSIAFIGGVLAKAGNQGLNRRILEAQFKKI
ncbi:hypothetical protein QEN19_002729 [Hanseniaspora menglaensis]